MTKVFSLSSLSVEPSAIFSHLKEIFFTIVYCWRCCPMSVV